nr:retrovirus-related Pol polyprotein from transposon TNT 1-94 [Tanacetum cinerariifolium]
MILESVENDPLLWPSIEENGVTRPKKYSELSATEAIQADCDVKATNIILQGLPPKEESLHEFYLIFSLLLNDMNIYNMKLEQFQVNTKFFNTLPPEWSKFVIDVKLVRDLHTTNVDQLHAYLGQHEFHVNEVRLMHECNSDPLALVATHQMTHMDHHIIHHNVYNPSSSIPQVEYAPSVNQQLDFSQPDSGLIVLLFQKGDDPIDVINHIMSFLTAVVTSRYPPTNNQLRDSSNPRQQATINNGRVTYVTESQHTAVQNSNFPAQQDALILLVIEQLKTQVVNCTKINLDNKSVNDTLTDELERYKDQVRILKEGNNIDKVSDSCAQSVEIDNLKQTLSKHFKEKESLKQTFFYDHTTKQALGFQNPFSLKKAQQLELKLYDGSVIQKTNAIVIRDSEETLMLAEESRSKMLLKQKGPMMSEKKVNTKPVDYNSVNSKEPNLSTRPTQVEVPKELPKVSMVNTSLKKLKHHLASFDVVVKERTTATAITEGKSFGHTALKDTLRKLKGKAIVDEVVILHHIDPELLKINVAPLAPKWRNNKTAHYDYLKHTQEETTTLREIVEHERSLNPLNTSLDYACDKLMAVTPMNKTQKVRFIESVTSSGNKPIKTSSSLIVVSNQPMLSSTGVTLPTSASRSQPSGNTKKDKIQQTPSSAKKNKLEAYPRNVVQIVLWYLDSGCSKPVTGDRSQLTNFVNKFLGDMMASSPIYLLSKASKTKSWLWHQRLSHLNFGVINHLARQGLVRGLPKLKFEKDHFCSACAMGKSKKKSQKPKSKDTNQEKLYLLHMDLYGPIRVESVNENKCESDISKQIMELSLLINHYVNIMSMLVSLMKHQLLTLHSKIVSLKDVMRQWLPHVTPKIVPFENLRKLQVKADIGIFIGYAPTKKAFQIYNRRTRRIIKTIHVDFDELTAMASEQSSLGPALHEMTPTKISSGLVPKPTSSTPFLPPLGPALHEMTPTTICSRLVPKPTSSTPFVPSSRNDWDLLFQTIFDKLLTPPPSVDPPAPKVIPPIADVIPPEQAESTGSPSSTTVDQDAPSLSK